MIDRDLKWTNRSKPNLEEMSESLPGPAKRKTPVRSDQPPRLDYDFSAPGIRDAVIVSNQSLLRQILARHLENFCDRVTGFGSLEQMLRAGRVSGDTIVLLEPVCEAPLASQVSAVIARSSACKIILLLKKLDEWDMGSCIRAGAVGCITQDTPSKTLGHLLALIHAGHIVWPASARNAASFNGRASDRGSKSAQRRPADFERKFAQLSRREKEVLNLLGKGLSNKRIADVMTISDTTVRLHMRSILIKLGAENRTQAALFALHAPSPES